MKCNCGCEIIFEAKKTFVKPDIKNGVCPKCGIHYILRDGKDLSKKDGSKDVS